MNKILVSLMLISISTFVAPFAAAQPDVEIGAVREGVDFTKYNMFLIQPLDISDTRLIPPPWAEDNQPRAWKISDKNAAFLRDRYQAAMRKQLQELGGYKLVDKPDPAALAVQIEIVSLTPWAKPDGEVITKGSGEMTFQAEVRDSMTREILVVYEGDVPVGEDYQEHTELTVQQNVMALFDSWGALLREGLEGAKNRSANSN